MRFPSGVSPHRSVPRPGRHHPEGMSAIGAAVVSDNGRPWLARASRGAHREGSRGQERVAQAADPGAADCEHESVDHAGHRRIEVDLANPRVLGACAASVDRACSDLMHSSSAGSVLPSGGRGLMLGGINQAGLAVAVSVCQIEAATRWLPTVWMIRPTVGGGWMPMLRSSLITATRLPDRAAVVGRLAGRQ
jgi:hypothetical protein